MEIHTLGAPSPVKKVKYEVQTKIRKEYNFKLEDNNYSRISNLKFRGINNIETVKYNYNKTGFLISVEKENVPNSEEHYSYKEYKGPELDEEAKALKYEDEGFLLSGIKTATDAEIEIDYKFVHVGSLANVDSDEDAKFSSFVITNKDVTGKVDKTDKINQESEYEGYDDVEIFNVLSQRLGGHGEKNSKETPDRGMAFKKIEVTSKASGSEERENVHKFKRGNLVYSKNPLGHVTTMIWDELLKKPKKVTSLKKGFLNRKTYTYDKYGYVSKIVEEGTNTNTKTSHVEYDRSPKLFDKNILSRVKTSYLESENKIHNKVTNEYDEIGNLLQTSTHKNVTKYKYDQNNNVKTITDGNGNVTSIEYANNILPSKTTVKDVNFVFETGYHPNLLLKKYEIDINGNKTEYIYDEKYRILNKKTIFSNKINKTHETVFTYNDDPDDLTVTVKTNFTDKSLDFLTTYKFNQFGKVYKKIVSGFREPGSGQVLGAENEKQETIYEYDGFLNIEKITDPKDAETSYEYDLLGRLVNVTTPLSEEINYQYQDALNTRVVIDGNGNKTYYKYDAFNNLKRVQLPEGQHSEYVYDGVNNLTSVKDLRGNITSYIYNQLNKVEEITHPNGNSESFVYDKIGNLIKHTDGNGTVANYQGYDSQGRPKTVDRFRGPGAKESIAFTYDQDNKGTLYKTARTYNSNQESRITNHDIYGNIVNEEKSFSHADTTKINQQVINSYSDAGLLLSKKTDNRATTYEYDKLGRIIKIFFTINGKKELLADTFDYDKNNLLKSYKLPRINVTNTYVYDKENRVDTITVMRQTEKGEQEIMYHDYNYDENGNREETNQRTISHGETFVNRDSSSQKTIEYNQDYKYDKNDQLIERSFFHTDGKEYKQNYKYDDAGNRTKFSFLGKSHKWKYKSKSDQIEFFWVTEKRGEAAWGEYYYDKNGNRLKYIQQDNKKVYEKHDYLWDMNNNLLTFSYNDKLAQSNRYDINNMRYMRTKYPKSKDRFIKPRNKWSNDHKTITTIYTYDNEQRLLKETHPLTPSLEKEGEIYYYVYLGAMKIARVEEVKGQNDIVGYYHNDVLGTPIVITTEVGKEGKVTKEYRTTYTDPWGNIDRSDDVGKNQYRQLYTGKFLDFSTDLYYFHARFYDSNVGRFIGKDRFKPTPVEPRSYNRYQYVYNNPINNIDPDGNAVAEGYNMISVSNLYHSFLFLIPNKIDDFKDTKFKKMFVDYEIDGDKIKAAILRAGPSGSYFDKDTGQYLKEGYLEAMPNHNDNPNVSPIMKIVSTPKGYSDTEFITKLLELNENYMKNPNKPGYSLPLLTNKLGISNANLFGLRVPVIKIKQEYNSNSYTSGLLNAAGIKDNVSLMHTPLYNKPVPESYFK
jgi:RHS repeat-associated protein